MNTKIGIYGGTFDPPHLGHLILAAEAFAQLKLKKIYWVLTPNPPHKRGRVITALEHRMAMLEAAISTDPAFELSRVDINRPAPHYALDTLRLLAQDQPMIEWVYLIGSDSLRDLPAWHRPEELIQTCSALGVMRRLGVRLSLPALELRLPGIAQKIQWIDAPRIDIASSLIRKRVAQGAPIRYLVPQPVYEIILKKGLYLPVLPNDRDVRQLR